MDYQNKLNSPDSLAQNPLGGLELVTAQTVFGSVNPQAYSFDPILNVWDALDDMPTAVVGAAQRAVGAKHYVIGGRVPGTKLVERLHGGKIEEYRELPTVEPCVGESQDLIQVLDPKASQGHQWETLKLPAGQGRSDAAAVVVKDKILVIGGCRVTWNDSKDFAVTGSNPVGPAVALSGKFTGNADVQYMLKVASLWLPTDIEVVNGIRKAGEVKSLQVSRNGGLGYQSTVTPVLDLNGNPTTSFGVGGGMTATVGASGLALVGDTYAFTAKGQNVEFLRNIDIFDPSTNTLKPSGALLPSARADAAAAANGLEVHVLGGWRLARGYVGALGTAAAGGEQDALIDEAAGDTNHVIFSATDSTVSRVSDASLEKGEPLHMTCSNNPAVGSGSNRVELVAAVVPDGLGGTQLIAAGGNCRSLQGFNRIAGAPGDPASAFLGYPPRPAASVNRDDSSNVDVLAL
jgi:hypothetical protein